MKKSVLQNLKSAFNLSYLALIVLFCFAVSTSFMSINYVAKYMSTDGGGDGSRVAKFDVVLTAVSIGSAKMNGLTNEEKQTDIQSYDFSITNNSEVAVAYDITVTFLNPLPEGVVPKVKLKGRADLTAKTVTDDRKAFTFESADFVFASENQTNQHTLTITVNYYDENNNLRNVDLTATEVHISVTAQQVD